jgi:uncharacterized protein
MFYLSALIVGFLGSFHCAGMCGPIALALPVDRTSPASILRGRLLYNGGRISTYMLMGLLAGGLGHTLALAGFQKALSISSGVIILLVAAASLTYAKISFLNHWFTGLTGLIKRRFKKLFSRKTPVTLFLIGSVNGILPCGFVYLALAAAVSSGNIVNSVSYMALFGLGTLPMMLFISMAGNFFGLRFNRWMSRATPYVAIAVALLLITRGINMTAQSCCHH